MPLPSSQCGCCLGSQLTFYVAARYEDQVGHVLLIYIIQLSDNRSMAQSLHLVPKVMAMGPATRIRSYEHHTKCFA